MRRYFALLFTALLFGSCDKDMSTINNTPTPSHLPKNPFDIKVTKWKLDHYTGDPDLYRIGIWPAWGDGVNNVPVAEYKNKFAFTDIIAQQTDQFEISLSYFGRWNTMVIIKNDQWWQAQINTKNVTRYYIDEPIETQGADTSKLREMYEYIKNYGPDDATLILSSRLRKPSTGDTIQMYREFINWEQPKMYILFSSYYMDNGYWWQQYADWTYFGTHSMSNWISAIFDYQEYSSLIDKAQSLGLNRIWLFIGADGGADKVSEFCYQLWEHGWLMYRYERKYYYHYHYEGENPPNHYDPNDPNWIFTGCQSTSDTRTVNRSLYSSFPVIDNDICELSQ